ncbi:MAG: hypothetical protein KBT47_05910 [Armatimonadetes bacterium]|nr:hypothetical protein [Candidatus Hippobium faecium]
MNYTLKQNGFISCFSGQGYSAIWDDSITITTDRKTYNLSETVPETKDSLYIYRTDDAEFRVSYKIGENPNFLKRKLSMKFKDKTRLLNISVSLPKIKDCFQYNTYVNASTAVFMREGDTGLCFGFENPYFSLRENCMGFEPNLILRDGEVFDCDSFFMGIYRLWGEKIDPELSVSKTKASERYVPRFRDPGEGYRLYFSEIKEFSDYCKEYFDIKNKKFFFMSYNNFSNLPQRPDKEYDVQVYKDHIDNCAELGIDAIIFNPLCRNKVPDQNENSFWELFPEGTYAKQLYDYSREKGLKTGMYMGVSENAFRSNSPLLNYADVKEWKKTDILGNISGENCLCSESFFDWYVKVCKNTIRKYDITVWCWDPGPGDGLYCYNEEHGHIAGKGEYKGFRKSLDVMRELKKEFPNLYIQGFYGNKKYGLWGFKYIDQHEGYWETHICCDIPIYRDLSTERFTADSVRFQSTRDYYFRFMHQTLNHGLCARMNQDCSYYYNIDTDLLFDHIGYRYNLLSAIACGGPVTLPVIPRHLDRIKGYTEFYRKWIKFAKDIFEYSKNTVVFGSQTHTKGAEGFAKIIDNEGYIFLVNSFPYPIETKFRLNERLGFRSDSKKLHSDLIYPYEEHIKENMSFDEEISVVTEGYGIDIIRISEEKQSLNTTELSQPLPRFLKGDGEYRFFADRKIKDIISAFDITEKEIKVGKEFNEKYKLTNYAWYRPDRLWLCVFNTENTPQAEINGEKTDLIWEKYLSDIKMTYYADITDYIHWEEENTISLSEPSLVYLHYAKPENERKPDRGENIKNTYTVAPILDESVKITEADVNGNNIIYQEKDNILRCRVNLPYEELEGVYATSVNASDRALEYRNGEWILEFPSPLRIHYILDENKFNIWAVTKDGRQSPIYPLKIDWVLDRTFRAEDNNERFFNLDI